jgi:dehydrogenase/reductase SDR family member 12
MDARVIADAVLEFSVVGSFSRLGYRARRSLFGWRDPVPGSLAGRRVLITGPTSGLGRAAADVLAGLDADLILVGRSEDRLAQVARELRADGARGRLDPVVADLSRLDSVRAAVERVAGLAPSLDVLIDNAGAIHPQRTVTPDGLEATFATLVVGPFAMVSGLLPLLRRSERGRVIAVTSGGMYAQPLDLDDLQLEATPYDGTRAYARAKRAQVTLVREWARRLRGTPGAPVVDAMHPGWADTPGLEASLPTFHRLMLPLLRTPEEGADTIAWLAAGGAPSGGGRLFLDRRPRPFDRLPGTRLEARERRRLWDLVVGLTGQPDPLPEPEGLSAS